MPDFNLEQLDYDPPDDINISCQCSGCTRPIYFGEKALILGEDAYCETCTPEQMYKETTKEDFKDFLLINNLLDKFYGQLYEDYIKTVDREYPEEDTDEHI